MDKTRWVILLMFLLLAGITVSQVYWMMQSYHLGKTQLEVRANTILERYATLQLQQELLTMTEGSNPRALLVEIAGEKDDTTDAGNLKQDSEKMALLHGVIEKVVEKSIDAAADTSGRITEKVLKRHHGALQKMMRESGLNIPFELLIRDREEKQRTISDIPAAAFERLPVKSKSVPLGLGLSELQMGFGKEALRDFTLRRMAWLLAGNVMLIVLAVLTLLYLTRTLLSQKKLTLLKDDFINNMTHELKTPVAAIQVVFEALEKYNFIEDPQKTRQYVATAGKELSRLSVLIDKLLNTSLMDQKGMVFHEGEVDLAALCREAAAGFETVFGKHGIRFSASYDPGRLLVPGDRDHLANVIYTLLDNACKYRGSDPLVQLQLYREKDRAVLKVRDNGIGIPEEHREAVFDKFYRVPTGNVHNIKGHGLGLYYVQQVVRHHKGTVSAGREEGFTVFTIELPLL